MAAPAEDFADEEEPAEAELDVEAEVEVEVESGELPSWLSDATPLAEMEEAEAEVELEDEGLPAWLDEMEPLGLEEDEAEAVEEPLAAELSEEAAPEAPEPQEPAVTAGEKVSIHDTLEWLNDIGSLEAEPEEGLEGDTLPVAGTESGPQWLRDVGMLQPEEHAGPEEEAETPEPEAEPEPQAQSGPRFTFQDFEPRWARPQSGSQAAPPPASLPEEAADYPPEDVSEPAADEPADDAQPWLDEASGPAWLRRVIEEEDDSEG